MAQHHEKSGLKELMRLRVASFMDANPRWPSSNWSYSKASPSKQAALTITAEMWQKSLWTKGMLEHGWSVKATHGHITTGTAQGPTLRKRKSLNWRTAVYLLMRLPYSPACLDEHRALATHLKMRCATHHAIDIAFESYFVPGHIPSVKHQEPASQRLTKPADEF